MTGHSLILKFTYLGEVAIDIPNGYDQINKYNGTMAHKFNHKFYEHNIRQSYVSNKSLFYHSDLQYSADIQLARKLNLAFFEFFT